MEPRAKNCPPRSKASRPVPRELKGHLSSTSKGAICFAANTKAGCKEASQGGRYRRGWHICCHKDCHLICSEKNKICNEANIGTQTLDNKASFEDLHRH